MGPGPLGLDCLKCAYWHGHFAFASLACDWAVFFDLRVLLAINVAEAQDDELAELCFYDLVDVEHLKLLFALLMVLL